MPTVPKLFSPWASCPRCEYAYDSTFRFCQNCGYKRILISDQGRTTDVTLDVPALDNRLLQIASASVSTCCAKRQKSSLQKELESFLALLRFPEDISTAIPRDLCHFLLWKDQKGKTKVHNTSCQFFARRGFCFQAHAHVRRVLPLTVDSLIGKLRAIFNEFGRRGESDPRLLLGKGVSF